MWTCPGGKYRYRDFVFRVLPFAFWAFFHMIFVHENIQTFRLAMESKRYCCNHRRRYWRKCAKEETSQSSTLVRNDIVNSVWKANEQKVSLEANADRRMA